MAYRTHSEQWAHECEVVAARASRPRTRSSTVLGLFILAAFVVLVAVPLARMVGGF